MTASPTLQFVEAHPPAGVRELGTLVLLHAFPLNAHMWDPQMPLAHSGWHVLAPHWRGLLADETPAESFDAMAEAVLELLSSLRVVWPVIGGVSMGGYLAFALLRHDPGLARGLILCDTRAEADPPTAREGRLKMLDLLTQNGVAAIVDDMTPRLLGRTTQARRPQIAERLRGVALENRAAGVGGVIKAMMNRPDSTSLLPSITCPTLVMVGAEDGLTPPQLSRAMHTAIPGSELIEIDETGHLPNLEQPERFNATISRFLASLP
ncbi:MAG: alpha/beta fold hydrolase [Vicinamibacterales bacterium]